MAPDGGGSLSVPGGVRFGQLRLDSSRRRVEAMLWAYVAGTLSVAVGLLAGSPAVLGLGALLLNVGTVCRYLVVALDVERLDAPVLLRA